MDHTRARRLDDWRRAHARVVELPRHSDAWLAAAAHEWRAQMAFLDAVIGALRQESAEREMQRRAPRSKRAAPRARRSVD